MNDREHFFVTAGCAIVAFLVGWVVGFGAGFDAAIEEAVKNGAAMKIKASIQWKGME